MAKIHLIAIGGAAMHNLALALQYKGDEITGSDDEIYNPSRSRLEKAGLLPKEMGWNADRITADLDTVIVGMHARKDNPELLKEWNDTSFKDLPKRWSKNINETLI